MDTSLAPLSGHIVQSQMTSDASGQSPRYQNHSGRGRGHGHDHESGRVHFHDCACDAVERGGGYEGRSVS